MEGYKTVHDLSTAEMAELKEVFYCTNNKDVSWSELIFVDELVSDDEIFDEYGDVLFTEDDFFCNQ